MSSSIQPLDRMDGDRGTDAYSAALPAKRVIETMLAFLLIVLLSPLLAAIALAVKADNRGPVLYRHDRAGRYGRPFKMLKFRTMHHDSDSRLQEILRHDSAKRREHEKYRKLFDDPRHSRIGRLLRRYSLDELPQLVNILRGEMLLVGPRPYVASELDDFPTAHDIILSAVPGLTGLWQVRGRNNLPFEERIRLDVAYATAYSARTDIAILLRTIPAVLRGTGAY